MNLLVRVNLALGTALGLAAVAVTYLCWSMLQVNARHEALREAGLMMDSALAIRDYTSTEILPLLAAQMRTEFLPQTIPFYAATQNFLKLRRQYPEYSYKEAALNPTNPRDRATDWEADVIQQFRNDPQRVEVVGERTTAMGRSLYLAKPIRMESECLPCHGQPAAAPQALLARYGSDNGFNWQDREIVGAHIVSVPFSRATASADAAFASLVAWIISVVVLILLIVNATVYFLVVRPVRTIAGIADEVSVGNLSAGEFPGRGSTELQGLARSFERMRISLEKAMKLLER